MEFGTNTRQDTTPQVNQVGVSTLKKTTSTQVSSKVQNPDMMDAVVAKSGLGNALTSFLDTAGAARFEVDKLKGVAIAANQTALTEIQKVSDRTGWEQFKYGVDASQQGIREQTARNALRGVTIKQAAEVSSFADLTPDKYYEKLTKSNTAFLEQYKDDPKTQRLIATQMQEQVQTLMDAHTKENYAWKQEVGNTKYKESVQQAFDEINILKDHAITEKDKLGLRTKALSVLNGLTKPETMNKKAQRTAMLDVVMENMREGNAGALLAAQATGLDKGLSIGERIKWNASVSSYDTQWKNKLDEIQAKAEMQIKFATDPIQVDAAASQMLLDIEEQFKLSSGSAFARKQEAIQGKNYADNVSKEQKLRDKLDADKKKIDYDAAKKTAELLENAKQEAALTEYFTTTDPFKKAELERDFDFTKKDLVQGFDTYLLNKAAIYMPDGKIPTITKLGQELRTNVQLQEFIGASIDQSNIESDVFKTIISSIVNGTDNLYDVDGKVKPESLEVVSVMKQLQKANKFVDMVGGKQASREWELRTRNLLSQQGKDATDKQLDKWEANKSKKDASGVGWKMVLDKDETRQKFIKGQFSDIGISNPTPQQVVDALQDFSDDMIMFSDKKLAINQFRARANSDTTQVLGHKLYGAAYLDSLVPNLSMKQLLTGMDKYQMLESQLSNLSPNNPIKSLQQLQSSNARVYVKDGFRGLFISTPTAAQEVFISEQEFKQVGEVLRQKKFVQSEAAKMRNLAETLKNKQILESRTWVMRP